MASFSSRVRKWLLCCASISAIDVATSKSGKQRKKPVVRKESGLLAALIFTVFLITANGMRKRDASAEAYRLGRRYALQSLGRTVLAKCISMSHPTSESKRGDLHAGGSRSVGAVRAARVTLPAVAARAAGAAAKTRVEHDGGNVLRIGAIECEYHGVAGLDVADARDLSAICHGGTAGEVVRAGAAAAGLDGNTGAADGTHGTECPVAALESAAKTTSPARSVATLAACCTRGCCRRLALLVLHPGQKAAAGQNDGTDNDREQ